MIFSPLPDGYAKHGNDNAHKETDKDVIDWTNMNGYYARSAIVRPGHEYGRTRQ